MRNSYCRLMLTLGVLGVVACGGSTDDEPKTSTGGVAGQSAQSGGRTGSGGSSSSTGGSSTSTGGKSTGGASTGGRTSGGGSSGGSTSSGGDDTRTFAELTDDERNAVCQAEAEKLDTPENKAQNCKLLGAFAAFQVLQDAEQMPAACQAAYDLCMDQEQSAQVECSDDLRECTATVAEFQACWDQLPAWFGALDVPSCEDVSLQTLLPLATLLTSLPQACQTLQDKCPEAVPDPTEM
ncbi:MAG TPA: hypothetical protein VFQ61_19850 [Polyangiaceae bacterium]|nr:hypothetical protein [Polyangiaceae bacterium]